MTAYYNEIDPFAAHCLRALIADGVIAPGDVDERSIKEVSPDDLKIYTQCHFFAGGGLWSVAARLAGWPDDRPLWTGSCPCQPFSVAGKGAGTDDPRHLWPDFYRLIAACRPPVVVGEQVAGAAGYGWLDGVRSDLEREGYASRGVDIPACAVNAPHIRQRLYWVAMADAASAGLPQRDGAGAFAARQSHAEPERRSDIFDVANATSRNASAEWLQRGGVNRLQPQDRYDRGLARDGERPALNMAHPESIGRRGRAHDEDAGRREQPPADSRAGGGDMGNAARNDKQRDRERDAGENGAGEARRSGLRDGDVANADDARREGRIIHAECAGERSAWSDGVEWRRGADGKSRRVKSGLCLLADGFPGRVGQLRIAGNAIVPQVAAEVIKALMETSL